MNMLTLEDMHQFDEAAGLRGRGSRAFGRRSPEFAQGLLSAVATEIDSRKGSRLKIPGDMIARQRLLLTGIRGFDLTTPKRDTF